MKRWEVTGFALSWTDKNNDGRIQCYSDVTKIPRSGQGCCRLAGEQIGC